MKGSVCNFFWVIPICLQLVSFGCASNASDNQNVNNSTNTTSINSQSQEAIRIGGSSSVYPALRAIATAYKQQNPNANISFLENTQTEAGIAGVKNQLLDIGGMSRELKPNESEGKVKYYGFGSDALIVATHSSVKGITNLTTQQLKDIYSGKVKNWQELGGENAKIVLLDRPEDESGKRLLREHYLGKELNNAPYAVVLRKEGDLIRAIQSTPYSIGAFSRAYALSNKLPVNILTLEGVAATSETINNGEYTMIRPVGIAASVSPSSASKDFVDFALSSDGRIALQNASYAPRVRTNDSGNK